MRKYVFVFLMMLGLLSGIIPENVMASTVVSDETKYAVNVTVEYNDDRLSDMTVTVSQGSETVSSATTSKRGVASFELVDGDYTASVSYTSDSYLYHGTINFTVSGEDVAITLDLDRDLTYSAAKKIYDDTDYYNHVDIRVNGAFTVGPADNLVTYNIKLKNVRLLVKDGNKTLISTTFTDETEDYEWRVMDQSIPNTAVVSLVFDIVLDGKVVRKDFATSFSGEEDFIQAIINCDKNQGLDFIMLPTEIISAALYDVSYVWTGLPNGLANVPATTEHALDYVYAIDTQFKNGDVIVDEINNKKYTFSGWQEWSNATDNHVTKNAIGSNTTITITNDTIIYGTWVVSDLIPESNNIVINKIFVGNDGKVPQNLLFKITDMVTLESHEVGLEMFDLNTTTGVYTYSFLVSSAGTYKVEELNYILPGYTFDTVNSTNVIQEINTDLTKEVSITFNNVYSKNNGNDLHDSKFIVEKVDSSNNEMLSGAIFTLYDQSGNVINTGITDNTGIVTFTDLREGIYILKETEAPNGYHLDSTEYNVFVTCTNSYEIFSDEQNAYVMQYEYSIDITPNDNYNSDSNKITVYNERIFGSISISKEFGVDSVYNKDNYLNDIKVLVTGVNNYNNIITLNSSNNFIVTLDNLELGNYTIVEIEDSAKIDGYTLDTVYTKRDITLTDVSYEEEIVITNTYTKIPENIYKETSFSVKKTDDNGNVLEGAVFGLYDADDKLIESKTTDKFGIVTFTGFKETATYVLKEISAPQNYHKVDTEWVVNVVLENGMPSFENGDNIYNFVVVIEDDNYDNGMFTVVNEIMTGSIVISKEVILTSRDEIVSKPESVKDVKYSFMVVIGDDTYTIELADGESKTFDNVPYGTEYRIIEIIPDDATWTHTAPDNANGIVLEEIVDVEMENVYIINNGNGEDPEGEEENNPDDEEDKPDGGDNDDSEGGNNVPQTGLNNNIYSYLVITLMGMFGLVLTIFRYRREF